MTPVISERTRTGIEVLFVTVWVAVLGVPSCVAGCGCVTTETEALIALPLQFSGKAGIPVAVTLNVPVRAPATVGRKVKVTWQLAPAARLAPQLCVPANSVVSPDSANAESAEPPVLVKVTTLVVAAPISVSAKTIGFGLAVKLPGATALAVSGIDRLAAFTALLVTVSVALCEPAAFGENATVTVQVAAGAKVLVQVLPTTYWVANADGTPTPLMLSGVAPVFLSVMTCAAEVVPTVVTGKVREAGVAVI